MNALCGLTFEYIQCTRELSIYKLCIVLGITDVIRWILTIPHFGL